MDTKKETPFVEYMNEMWFSSHQTWYEGARINTPSTNNALESFNLIIKKEQNLRERLPLGRFFELCIQSVEKWSREYLNGDKVFYKTSTISLSDWTAAYQWAKLNKSYQMNAMI